MIDMPERDKLEAERRELVNIMARVKPEDMLTKMSLMGKLKAVIRDIGNLPPKPT